tara:strand:- start:1240 stop:1380 length:141 start_codon:yes stop_codon:yes gene_type:complete
VTPLENIEYSITKIDAMLSQDFMSPPVREILTDIKSKLEAAKADLS